jgi:formyl-CoA transferase
MQHRNSAAAENLPLSGLRVIELGMVVAGPFCGSMLADMGAEVIKVEPPGLGDPQRVMGHEKNGVPIWWGVDAREKKCITLNLKNSEGRQLFLNLVQSADILVENYRPGVLTRLGLDWPMLSSLNGRLIMLTITGYGETGPKSLMPGFGKVAEGISGMLPLVGSPRDKSVFVGFSLADASSAMLGLFGLSVALYRRDILGTLGTHIDLALYEPLLRMLDCRFAMNLSDAHVGTRNDNYPYAWGVPRENEPQILCVRSIENEWLAILIPHQDVEQRMVAVLAESGSKNLDKDGILELLMEWASFHTRDEILKQFTQFGAEIAPIFDGLSIARSSYFRNRGDVLDVETEFGLISVPGPYPKDPNHIDSMTRFRPAPLGGDNVEVFSREFGMNQDDVAALKKSSAI